MGESVTDLARRKAPLEMGGEEFRQAGHRLVEDLAAFLDSLPGRPVNRDEGPKDLRRLLPGQLPDGGLAASALLQEATSLLVEHSLFNGHPRFLGYVTSSAAPIGALADLLAAAINPKCGGWQLSPTGDARSRGRRSGGSPSSSAYRRVRRPAGERRQHGQLRRLPRGAARCCRGVRIRSQGVAGSLLLSTRPPRPTRGSRKRPTCSASAPRPFAGFPRMTTPASTSSSCARQLDLDRRPRAPALPARRERRDGQHRRRRSAPRDGPDRRENDLWLHVDGAYGALAVLCAEAPDDLRGVALADSVAMDPHKWLYAPLEAGCVLVRNPQSLVDAFSYTPPYYRFTGEEEDRSTTSSSACRTPAGSAPSRSGWRFARSGARDIAA